MQRNVYDQRDELVRADYAVDVTTGGASTGVEETITYDADGHALITNHYYALGTTIDARPTQQVDPFLNGAINAIVNKGSGTDVGGELDNATVDFYDAVGRMSEEVTFGNPTNWDGTPDTPPTTPPTPDSTTYGNLTMQNEVVYQGPNGSAGYDADGDVVAYQYRDGSGRIDQYQVGYLRKDGYLQSETTGVNVSDTPNVQPSTDQTIYDTRGNQVALEQHTEAPSGMLADTVRVFAYNGNGEIIERQDGTGSSGTSLDQGSNPATQVQHYVYVDGQQLAHYDNAGTLDVLSEVTAFSSNNDSPDSYVVQAGDTLESIAQAEYGDASLWYVLAQANGLSSDNDLSLGQRLQIPTVTTHSNTATTVKPYDPSSIVGDTTPSLPTIAPPPPLSSHHCNALAEIAVFAVQLVVTSALGPIAGNIAGQLTGDALGVHQGIDLGETAVYSATQVIAAALAIPTGGGSEGVAAADEVADAADSASTVASDLVGSSAFAQAALTAGASYVGGYAVAKIVGEPAHFSWEGLVATSLSAGITSEFGPTLAQLNSGEAGGSLLPNFLSGALQGTLTRETSLALGDRHVQSFEQIGEQAAGTALGNAALGAYNNYENQPSLSALNTSVNQSLNNETNGIDAGLANAGANAAEQNTINNGQLALSEAWQGFQTNNDGALAAQPSNDGLSLLGSAWQQQSDLGETNSAWAAYNAANYQQSDAGLPTDAQMQAAIDNGPQLAYVQPRQILSPFDLESDTLSTDASGPLGPQTTPADVTSASFGGVLGTATTSGTNLGSSSASGLLANQTDASTPAWDAYPVNQTASEQIAEDGPNGLNGYIGNLDFTPSPSGELPPIDGITNLPIAISLTTNLDVQDLVPSSLSPVTGMDAGSLVDSTPTSATTIGSLTESAGQGLADGIVDGLRPAGTFLGEEAGRIALGQYDQTLAGRGLQFLASEQNDVLSDNAQQTQTYQFAQAVGGTVSGIVDDPAAALNEGYNYAIDWASHGIESVANSLSTSTPDQIAYNISHGVGVVASGVGVGKVGETVLGAAGEIVSESAEPARDIGGANPANVTNLDTVNVNGSVPSAAGVGPTGNSYSVAYQMELDPASYPGLSRGSHFQKANEALLTSMEADPEFAQMMQNLEVDVQRTPTGLAPRTSPKDWTWHHAEDPGVMQLVPRSQHAPGSIFQDALHPGGRGGYSIWGK